MKLLRIILKTKGVPSIIEYNKPKMILESVKLEIKAGKTVLKSSIDIVRARNAPCQMNIIYTFLGVLSFTGKTHFHTSLIRFYFTISIYS